MALAEDPDTTMADDWLDTDEAARRLGVKPATLYAYVSRGQLRRRHTDGGRRSAYHAGDVAALAVRSRRARPIRPSDVVVPTAVTAITPDGPAYRGRLAVDLAGTAGYEEVAAHLWQVTDDGPWEAAPVQLDVARVAVAALDGHSDPSARIPAIVAAVRAADPLRHDLGRSAVVTAARGLIVALTDVATADSSADSSADSTARPMPAAPGIAGRLAAAVGAGDEPGAAAGVDAALVLLADHELAASTLAARIAASARSDPYAVVLAGAAVVTGTRHGAASRPLERVLAEVSAGRTPAEALGAALGGDAGAIGAGAGVPGFGHPLYPDGDPRAGRLVALLEEGPLGPRLDPLRALLATAERRGLAPPNVDAALAGLTHALGAPAGTGELLFAIARTAGWIAHALEQYAAPELLRPRAVYTGP